MERLLCADPDRQHELLQRVAVGDVEDSVRVGAFAATLYALQGEYVTGKQCTAVKIALHGLCVLEYEATTFREVLQAVSQLHGMKEEHVIERDAEQRHRMYELHVEADLCIELEGVHDTLAVLPRHAEQIAARAGDVHPLSLGVPGEDQLPVLKHVQLQQATNACDSLATGTERAPCLEVHGTYSPIITALIAHLYTP